MTLSFAIAQSQYFYLHHRSSVTKQMISMVSLLPVFKHHVWKERKQEKKKLSVLKVTAGVFVLIISLLNILDTDFFYSKYVGLEQNRKDQFRRSLTVNLGAGQCEWKGPVDAPQDTEVFSTLLTAYPGSGKRTAFMQLEGMTELRTGDDYGFTNPDAPPDTKYAFMKSSYPHHEGTWSFGSQMSQTILLVRNPRWALVNYHHMTYELDYSETWLDSYKRRLNVYTMRPPVADWVQWRNSRFDLEIKKWGWYIDYWMEGGLLRDILTNDLTTSEHFEHTTQPLLYGEAELVAEQVSLGVVSPPEYDKHCVSNMEDCKPVAIASFEKMIEKETGCEEVDRFLAALEGKAGMSVIEREARECVWEELIVLGKGNEKTFQNRKGPAKNDFGFRPPEMRKIQAELQRLREKYSTSEDWINDPIAQSLVGYLDEYIAENGEELKFVTYN
jgi:hypothetical protein